MLCYYIVVSKNPIFAIESFAYLSKPENNGILVA
jgi:hypothetical protein